MWTVKDQIITDKVTGLTIQFESMPGSDAPYRLRLFSDSLPFGNREILFDTLGMEAGSSTFTGGLCKPAWSIKPDDLGGDDAQTES